MNNDPFYVGSPGQVEKARWFKEVYELMGSPARCHIRRVHYWLVSQKGYKKPDGSTYENTENDWNFITLCAKYARYLTFVPFENIEDHRNPDPVVNVSDRDHQNPTEIKEETDADSIINDIVWNFRAYNPHRTQKYMLEIWCEKSTMNDILEPFSSRHGINLIVGVGELSITSVHLLANRIKETGKPTRVFYISDFDPAGECMPVSVARKLEYFLRQEEITEDVKLVQIMLKREQCVKYALPRKPIKESEKRKEGFEDRHGTGATELDALEALHPGEMRKILERSVLPYFNVDGWNEAINLNSKIQRKVKEFLQGKITNVLEELDVSEFDDADLPEGEEIDDIEVDWLLDNELDYMEQIEKYKDFKSG